jgi:nucleoside-diphosphate-sugar epimerase
MHRFLVTGARGCIGSWVLRQLVREGVEVIGADADRAEHRVRALLGREELESVTFLEADISRPADIDRLFSHGPTHVVHLAALQVPACRADPVRGAEVNVAGSIGLFAAVADAGLTTSLAYASSAAAFAAADGDGVPPSAPSGQPDTHYGIFKLANEASARIFAAERGVNSVGLRPYVVYGPGRDRGLTSAPTQAMRAAANGAEFVIPYSGRSELQFAPDVAAAFIAAARSSYSGATVLNVPGTNVSVDEVIEEIERVVPESKGRIKSEGPSLPFPEELDSTAFRAVVGEVQLTPLAAGVAETIRHFRSPGSGAG